MKELNLEDILSKTPDLQEEKKVWYVAIIGRPNAWKSTFINTLLWEKVSITSNVPQTTRKRVLAIHNDTESQIIFFDTPGIDKPSSTPVTVPEICTCAAAWNATNSKNARKIVNFFIDKNFRFINN